MAIAPAREREKEAWFAGSGEVIIPKTPVGNPSENKPLQDPGGYSREPQWLGRNAGRYLIFCAVRHIRIVKFRVSPSTCRR